MLTQALALVDQTGERLYEAELHRLKGKLLLRATSDGHDAAEDHFHQAMAVARNQSATSWELRATLSLARLWQQQGKQMDALALLAPVYDGFTEGFDTADLREARAMLGDLPDGSVSR